ncbi:hypothetical protein [Streptomyces sp. NPDC014006]
MGSPRFFDPRSVAVVGASVNPAVEHVVVAVPAPHVRRVVDTAV